MDKAELCRRAAWLIHAGEYRGICGALDAAGGAHAARWAVAEDIGDHLGEVFNGSNFARRLPDPRGPGWRQARAARIDLLSLAAEYYEAEAEGRVHR